MSDLFDDLLGEVDERPEIAPAPYGRDFSLKFVDVHEVERGVTVPWLCQAFTMPKTQVEAKLKDCPAIRSNRGSKSTTSEPQPVIWSSRVSTSKATSRTSIRKICLKSSNVNFGQRDSP